MDSGSSPERQKLLTCSFNLCNLCNLWALFFLKPLVVPVTKICLLFSAPRGYNDLLTRPV